MTDKNDIVSLKLTRKQALVLFEWLANSEDLEMPICQNPGEEIVLWKLQSQLESALTEPFASNYRELLVEARISVESGEG